MSRFPAEPISPREFIEEVVPALFAEVELQAAEEAIDLRIGVVLEGEGGGEWTIHFVEGELGIESVRHEVCDLTLVQRVEDWRAALWEGRPALIAEGVARIRDSGPGAMRPPAPPGGGAPIDPLKGLADLRGLIEAVIEDEAGRDWRVGVLVGGGALPDEAHATIRLGADQADAIREGRLHPLEALITGQLQLDGDLGLILQLQAVAMTLSMAAGGGPSR